MGTKLVRWLFGPWARIRELERLLDEERATIVSVACASVPLCAAKIRRLEEELARLSPKK